jgi:NAD(P)-dependent dehydrogenase (short-subunit alcohol dehydrogenase family)
MSRNVLITGANGNLGTACRSYFEAEQVMAISRQSGDLTNPYAVKSILHDIPDQNHKFDLVIMTHGTQQTCTIEDYSMTDWEIIIGNNLQSAVILTSELVKQGRLADNSLIVYCSSIQASHPRKGRFLYGIAKAGLETLVKAVHSELTPKVRSVALRLGQMEQLMGDMEFTDEQRQAIERYTPLPWVSLAETAQLIDTLYYQASLSGIVIPINSGHPLSVWPDEV